MARHGLEVAGLALVVAATTLCALCSAQTTATVQPMTMPNCAPVPISLSPCIGYVFGFGSATLTACCSQVQAFFQSQGPCLCAMSKLAPSPFGLVLGQLQGMIPNVCNLPSNSCDDVATSPEASMPPVATAPAAPLDPTAPTAPVITPAATPAAPANTTSTTQPGADVYGAPPVPADDPPAAVAAPGEVAPEGAGSNTGSQGASKLPELMHAAGAPSSRDTAAGSVLITLFLAYVSTMYV